MMKMKAEARLDLLREVGVAVETWLKSAMNQVMEELENECWNNLSGHDASLSVRPTGTLLNHSVFPQVPHLKMLNESRTAPAPPAAQRKNDFTERLMEM